MNETQREPMMNFSYQTPHFENLNEHKRYSPTNWRLHASQNDKYEEQYDYDIREDLVPLYQRAMNVLAMSMRDWEHLTLLKRKNKKRIINWDNMVNTNVNERTVIMDVRSSDLGIGFL